MLNLKLMNFPQYPITVITLFYYGSFNGLFNLIVIIINNPSNL